ncbi:hypothetical protein [Actinoplanes sp. N902-109]|uniref:hypothetical protein n=1 Tax=Actinoplanes sp. (strain N902-109) TaxID=649831 RepID=UPI0005A16BD5|nr:hypothetical protein [Actinoplanes sp. N902-109]
MRRRFITPIAVLTGLFGLGAASANAAGRVAADDQQKTAAVVPAATPSAGLKLIAGYSGSTHWYGPRLTLPARKYEAIATYTCDNGGFLYVSWNGEPYSYESAKSSDGSGTVVLQGVDGGTRGYFAVDSWLGCAWTMKVYA